ncbi:MAG: RDD family protein, partial [Phycisphaerales bacterium]|nr:RDD family protein [Phycisphaerales bacterium]
MKLIGRFSGSRFPARRSAASCLAFIAALIATFHVERAAAQLATQRAEVTLLNATEDRLWLVDAHAKAWRLSARLIQSKFTRPIEWNGHVVRITPAADRLLAFFDDGSVYRTGETSGLTPEPSLPGSRPPIDATAVGDRPYALLRSVDASGLLGDGGGAPTDVQAADSKMIVATIDGGVWKLVGRCPPALQVSESPSARIGRSGGALIVAGYDAASKTVRSWQLDLPTGAWTELDALRLEMRPDSIWICEANRAASLITVLPGSSGARIDVYRHMPRASGDQAKMAWREIEPKWSAAPDGFQPVQVRGAAGFNQHLAVLGVDAPGLALVRFARFDDEPVEKTLDVREVFERADPVATISGPLQIATLFILIVVFSLLFTLRRGAMIEAAALPPGWEPALSTQRLIAGAIDFLPFSFIMAALLGLSWTESFKQIGQWALSTTFDAELVDPFRLLLWWGLSSTSYTAYALVMELLTQRTIGKVVMRLRLMGDTGSRPLMWQIVLRNALRLVELLPP